MFPNNNNFDMNISLEREGNSLPENTPFRILVLGDWSGRGVNGSQQNQKYNKPIEIDRDNFDVVLGEMQVTLNLQFSSDESQRLFFEFKELDDFHPDKIFESQPLFDQLRNIRRQLMDSRTFNVAAKEVRSWFLEDLEESNFQTNKVGDSFEQHSNAENLLSQILEENNSSDSPRNSQTIDSKSLRSFVKSITKSHIIQIDSEEQSKLLMVIDEVISDLMRKILHHPSFQSLEASWRGLFLLVRRVETNSNLKIYVSDVNKPELLDNLKSVEDLDDSVLASILQINDFDDADISPWAVVLGGFEFTIDILDVAALIRIGKLSARNNVSFVSNIKPTLFGLNSFGEFDSSGVLIPSAESTQGKLWNTLCSMPESGYIALVLQKVLGRMPYGGNTEPTERFFFEEFLDKVLHENFLWINPVFYIGIALADAFQKNEWYIKSNLGLEIGNLPVYFYQLDGETVTKPLSEVLLTQSNMTKIIENGFTPLVSPRNSDSLRISSLPTIYKPATFVMGKWK